VLALEGISPGFIRWCEKSAAVDPWSTRLQRLSARTSSFTIDETGQFEAIRVQSSYPARAASHIVNQLALDQVYSLPHWEGAAVEYAEGSDGRVVCTGPQAWAYAAVIPWESHPDLESDLRYWACLDVEVVSGRVGIAAFTGDDLLDERTVPVSDGRKTVAVRIADTRIEGIMIRNGGLPMESRIVVHAARLECEPGVT